MCAVLSYSGNRRDGHCAVKSDIWPWGCLHNGRGGRDFRYKLMNWCKGESQMKNRLMIHEWMSDDMHDDRPQSPDVYSRSSIFVVWYASSVRWDTHTVRESLWNYRHPPPLSRTETKDLFLDLRFNCSKVFTVKVESFSKPFQPRLKERKKLNFWKEPQRRPYTMVNFPSSQNCHSLRAFSQFWEEGRIAGGWMIKSK